MSKKVRKVRGAYVPLQTGKKGNRVPLLLNRESGGEAGGMVSQQERTAAGSLETWSVGESSSCGSRRKFCMLALRKHTMHRLLCIRTAKVKMKIRDR